MVRRDNDDVGSARTAAASIASSETVATSDSSLASSETVASSDSSLAGSGYVTPESLTVVAPSVYIQLDELARGGLGKIIRAKDTRTGRMVAIKEMLSSTEDAALRFAREAMITANLQHPAIVPVYEVGRWTSGQPFYAMKLVSGRPLDQVIAATTSIDDRLALVSHVLAVADALAYAHGERVIHRDLKPHNVLVGAHGETVVIDWGLARRLDESENPATSHRVISAVPGQTYIGAVMGTPAYMPPEQASGARVDERADVYAIGAMLYHLLAGKAPYAGKTIDELLAKVRAGSLQTLTSVDPSIPADLAAIVERAMAREPAERYASAAELAADLRRFTTGQLVSAHHYTRMQRLGRFVSRNRAAVAIATVAIVTGAIGGTIAVHNVLEARDAATAEQARAEAARDIAQQRLVEARVDRARSELAVGHEDLALAFTIAAAEIGGLDDRLRFIAGRALANQTAMTRLPEPGVTSITGIPGTADTIVSTSTGLQRWDPAGQRVVWTRQDGFAGDVLPLDASSMIAARMHGLEIFDLETGKVLQKLQTDPAQNFQGMIGIDRGRRWLGAPVFRGAIALFDLETRALVTTIPTKLVDNVPLISRDGQRLVVAAAVSDVQKRIFITDRTGAITSALCDNCHIKRYFGEDILTVEVAARLPAKIKIFDWSGRMKAELVPTMTGDVSDVVVFDDDQHFAIVLQGGTLEVHHRENGLQWRRHIDETAFTVHVDKQARLWVLGNSKGSYVFDAMSGMPLARSRAGGAAIALTDDGTRATTATIGRGVASFEVRSSMLPLVPSQSRVRRLVFAGPDRYVTGSEDGLVAVIEPGKPMRELVRHAAKVQYLQLLDDKVILSSGWDGKTYLHDLDTGAQLATIEHGPYAAASPDGRLIAIGTRTGDVLFWDRTSAPQLLAKLPNAITAVRWSADGQRFGAIDDRGAVEVWDRNRTSVLKLPPANRTALDLHFSRRNRWLGLSLQNFTEVLRSLEPGTPDLTLDSLTDGQHYAFMFAFSEDDSLVAIAGSQSLGIWELPSGKLRRSFSIGSAAIATVFSRDARMLFSGGVDRRARIWDVTAGVEIESIEAASEVYNLVLAPDGERLGVLTLGPALVWDLAPYTGTLDELKQQAECLIDVTVIDGALVKQKVDAAKCNARARRQ